MDPFSLAGIVVIVWTGALTRVGEIALDGTIDELKRLIQAKSPETFKKLQAAANNPTALPETIEVMATLIENDGELKAVAEKVAQENKTKPDVINQFTRLEKIINFANGNINIENQNINI